MNDLIKVFSGTQITVENVKNALESAGIGSIIRNDFQSGIIAGFGVTPSHVELFVDQSNMQRATDIIKEFISEVED